LSWVSAAIATENGNKSFSDPGQDMIAEVP